MRLFVQHLDWSWENSLVSNRQEVIRGRRSSRANAGAGWIKDSIDIKLFCQNNLKVRSETWLGVIFQSILNSAVEIFFLDSLGSGKPRKVLE